MPTNRVRIRGNDGRYYWYNPNTRRLFKSANGMNEVTGFTYQQGRLTLAAPAGGGSRGGQGRTPRGPFGYHPTDPSGDPRFPDPEPYVPPGDRDRDGDDDGGGGGGDNPFEDDPCPPGFHIVNEGGSWRCVADEDSFDEDFFQELISTLEEWGLTGLEEWVRQSIVEGKGWHQIIRELRETDVYKLAFPEQAMRKQNGFTFMPEAEIIAYRNGARSLLRQVFGVKDITQGQIASLIGNGKSLDEFAHDLQVWKVVQERGPEVKALFETILGVNLSDDDLRELFDPDISTPELDRAFEDALYRGLPAMLGLGTRPQDEADRLRAFGINPDEAFAGYQEVAGQLPLFRKLDAIDNALAGKDNLPTGNDLFNDTPLMQLIAGIQFRDPMALERLSNTLAREGARWFGGGGALSTEGRQVGRLSRSQR